MLPVIDLQIDILPCLQITLNAGLGCFFFMPQTCSAQGAAMTLYSVCICRHTRYSKDDRICIYLWILFTSVTCLQVLDQIIEDRKRRVQLEVLLLVLLQPLRSIFLSQTSIFGEC